MRSTLSPVRRLHRATIGGTDRPSRYRSAVASAGIAGLAAAVVAVGTGAMLDVHQVDGQGRYAGPSICEHQSGSLAEVPGQPDTVRITYEKTPEYGGGESTFVLDLRKDQSAVQGWLKAEQMGQHLDVHYCWNEVK